MSDIKLSRKGPANRGDMAGFAVAVALGIAGLSAPASASSDTLRGKAVVSNSVQAWLKPERGTYTRTQLAQARTEARNGLVFFGNGTYICSASGFGSTSRCFSR